MLDANILILFLKSLDGIFKTKRVSLYPIAMLLQKIKLISKINLTIH